MTIRLGSFGRTMVTVAAMAATALVLVSVFSSEQVLARHVVPASALPPRASKPVAPSSADLMYSAAICLNMGTPVAEDAYANTVEGASDYDEPDQPKKIEDTRSKSVPFIARIAYDACDTKDNPLQKSEILQVPQNDTVATAIVRDEDGTLHELTITREGFGIHNTFTVVDQIIKLYNKSDE